MCLQTTPACCRASVGLRLKSKLSAEQLASAGLQQSEIPAIDAAMVCPWRLAWGPMHIPSIIVGVIRVYGAAKREWSAWAPEDPAMESCTCIELYDGNDVLFCFPQVKGGILEWDGPSVDKKQA